MQLRKHLPFFLDELEKIAIDPATLAALVVSGKILGHNALVRHGMRFKPLRRLASETLGLGARAGMAGKPLMTKPTREALALALDPELVSMLEHGYSAGTNLGLRNLWETKNIATNPKMKELLGLHAQDVLSRVPLTADTRIRKALDYGLTPVGQVGRDIAGKVAPVTNKIRKVVDYGSTPVNQVGSDLMALVSKKVKFPNLSSNLS